MPQFVTQSEVQIVAIVNSLNRIELLQLGFPTLFCALQKGELPAAIVVFEAGSSDGSTRWLEDFSASHPGIEIVVHRAETGEDTSFSAGVNTACRVAGERFPGARFYFLFETDNWLADEAPLVGALDFLQNGPRDVCAAGFTVQKHAGTAPGYGSPFPRPLDFVIGPQLTQKLGRDTPKAVWKRFKTQKWSYCDVIYTSPLLIFRADWDLVGGLDAKLFPFSECDLDLAWRLAKKGRKMAVLSSEGVIHDNKSQLSAWSATRALQFHRARYLLLRRFYGAKIAAILPLLFGRHLLECAGVVLLAAKIKNPRATLAKRALLLRRVFAQYR